MLNLSGAAVPATQVVEWKPRLTLPYIGCAAALSGALATFVLFSAAGLREMALVSALIAALAYWQLPSPKVAVDPRKDPDLPFVGDAAGEHESAARVYDARVYVAAAFFGQVAVWSAIVHFLLTLALTDVGDSANEALWAGSTVGGTAIALWIYWDRWLCITSFVGSLCSGWANVSILYVPIIAFFYATHRGILKFARR